MDQGLGNNMELDLNNSRWKLQEAAVQRRSDLFWKLFVADTWMVRIIFNSTLPRNRLSFFAELSSWATVHHL